MSGDQLIGRATGPAIEIVRNIKADQLDAPTPCADFDVRRLVQHLLFWGPPQEAAARKEIVPPAAEAETDIDVTRNDWSGDLIAHLERMSQAWSAPEAWQGMTQVGGPPQMPATTIGGMVLGEIVLHGWDLAHATGQHPVWDGEVLAFVHRELEGTAEMGRQLGLYGPEVPVPADAPLLHRILGLSGRQPQTAT